MLLKTTTDLLECDPLLVDVSHLVCPAKSDKPFRDNK